MHKRRFLGAMAVTTVASPVHTTAFSASRKSTASTPGPTLLTVTGAIGAGNRGPFDPALDQLMAKQKLAFTKAHAFDFAAISALPAITIKPTVEYDGKPHALSGPLLLDVLNAAGAKTGASTVMLVRAIDGYAAQIAAAEAAKRRFIVATHLDGRPLALGGLGPLWTVYDADAFADTAALPIAQRFGSCPWATYHVEVREG